MVRPHPCQKIHIPTTLGRMAPPPETGTHSRPMWHPPAGYTATASCAPSARIRAEFGDGPVDPACRKYLCWKGNQAGYRHDSFIAEDAVALTGMIWNRRDALLAPALSSSTFVL